MKKSKVAIIGAGHVGSSIANFLMLQGVCHDILLVDKNTALAYAQALDLQDCAEYLNRAVSIYPGHYEDCHNADIVIISAAVPLIKGQTRIDMTASSAKIIKEIVPPIMESGFNGHFIIVTNPVDIMSYYVYRLSGLPKNKVIGTGTALDSARLKKMISRLIAVDIKSIQAYSIGEHGDSQVIPWSLVTAGGIAIQDIGSDYQNQPDIDYSAIERNIINSGWDIANVKGTTNYGIASIAAAIVQAILNDENKIMPVSAMLEGEFGEYDIFAGVPAIINHQGLKEILKIHITEKELCLFKKSIDVIRNAVSQLELSQ